MPRNGDCTWLGCVVILAMAAFLPHHFPAIVLDLSNGVPNFHLLILQLSRSGDAADMRVYRGSHLGSVIT